MFPTAHRPPRPRLTGMIALYALGDVFGLSCVAIGASYFIADKGAIFSGFPASTAEAVACTAGGVVLNPARSWLAQRCNSRSVAHTNSSIIS